MSTSISDNRHLEFFAGIGGVAHGLRSDWRTVFATDYDESKKETYLANAGKEQTRYLVKDILKMQTEDIPAGELSSCTFPCTNTSAAGDRTGLMGIRSGVVYRYMRLLEEKGGAAAYPLGMMENPSGLISRNKGRDLADLTGRMNKLGYSVLMCVVDAKHFVPQSRPRLFISAFERSLVDGVHERLVDKRQLPANKDLVPTPLRNWMENNTHLDLLVPPAGGLPERTIQLTDVIDLDDHDSAAWADERFSAELVRNMTDRHRVTLERMMRSPTAVVASVARRGRIRDDGDRFNATELSLSGVAPCQRPYSGGSSRAWICVAGMGKYRFKVITPRESARLMGLDDSFVLPAGEKAAYQATGDAVVPQAVAWVNKNIIMPAVHASGRSDIGQIARAF